MGTPISGRFKSALVIGKVVVGFERIFSTREKICTKQELSSMEFISDAWMLMWQQAD